MFSPHRVQTIPPYASTEHDRVMGRFEIFISFFFFFGVHISEQTIVTLYSHTGFGEYQPDLSYSKEDRQSYNKNSNEWEQKYTPEMSKHFCLNSYENTRVE